MYWLTKGESSGPRPLNMACQLKEKKKPKHARTRTHTHALTQNKTKQKQYLSTVYLIYNKHKLNYFTMLPFLIQKMPILGVYIYFFFSVVYCWLIFKYISVTTCNCFLYLTAFPFIYLHVSSFHLPKVSGWQADGCLFSVKLNAAVLNTGQKMFDCHFNTWK